MSKIDLQHLSFQYDGQPERLFDDANLILDSDWKLGLIGRNGRGKTTLLKLLMGREAYQGHIKSSVPFVYFPAMIKDPTQLTLYALEAVANFEQWQLERELNLIQFNPDLLWQPFNSLSGGEQTKVLLALLFTQPDQFSLIDEPTNHLDMAARQHVADYLKQKSGFIVVSHDRHFIDTVVDHILAIEKRQLVRVQGDYTNYETQKKRQDETELALNNKLKKEVSRLKQTATEKPNGHSPVNKINMVTATLRAVAVRLTPVLLAPVRPEP